MGSIDKCTITDNANKKYLLKPLVAAKAIIRIAKAIPDLIPDENNTCTLGVKKTIKNKGRM